MQSEEWGRQGQRNTMEARAKQESKEGEKGVKEKLRQSYTSTEIKQIYKENGDRKKKGTTEENVGQGEGGEKGRRNRS